MVKAPYSIDLFEKKEQPLSFKRLVCYGVIGPRRKVVEVLCVLYIVKISEVQTRIKLEIVQ